MQETLLKKLANDINISDVDLIKCFLDIGIFKKKDSYINNQEKKKLFLYFRKNMKFRKNIMFQKKISEILNVSSCNEGKKVEVEFKIATHCSIIKNNKKNGIKHNSIRKTQLHTTKYELNQKKNILHSPILSTKEKNDCRVLNTNKKNLFHKIKNKKLELNQVTKKLYKFDKKNKIPINKVISSISDNSKKSYKFNKTSQHKKNFSVPVKTMNYINNPSLNYKYRVKNKNLKQSHLIKKNYIEKKLLKTDNYVQNKHTKNSCLKQIFKKPKQIINRDIIIRNDITVSDLAKKMAIKTTTLIKKMMLLGINVSINQIVNFKTISLIAKEIGHKVIIQKENTLEDMVIQDRNIDKRIIKSRPPIVTIMGHVDHGKTSLLDHIRSSKIASRESGGITQHIGAYHIKFNNNIITFLDTPGHSAFTAMRMRGAQLTDIIILVVASDDGVKPQTIEAIKHAEVANVPIIVVISKIDKLEQGNLDKIKNELSKYKILSEEWGGQNIFVNVSVKKGIGIKDLLNAIILQSEILELKVTFNGMAKGVVIESYLDTGRGPIATILVKEGMLNKGDIVISGLEYGKVRAIINEDGKMILQVGPSIPVEILGLSGMPIAGEEFLVVKSEKKAKEVILHRRYKCREVKLSGKKRLKLEKLFEDIKKDTIVELKIILKVDKQGSLEAISESLYKMSTDKVKINIVSSGVGSITETDSSLAVATNAVILGFNVRADSLAKKIIEFENLDLRYYSIIYNLLDEVKEAMTGLLVPKYKQEIIGLAEVRNIFKSPKYNIIAGCMIIEGIIKRNNPIRILRNNVVIYEGELDSLRRFKEDIDELRNGMECGIGVKNYNNLRIGDKIEVFKTTPIKYVN